MKKLLSIILIFIFVSFSFADGGKDFTLMKKGSVATEDGYFYTKAGHLAVGKLALFKSESSQLHVVEMDRQLKLFENEKDYLNKLFAVKEQNYQLQITTLTKQYEQVLVSDSAWYNRKDLYFGTGFFLGATLTTFVVYAVSSAYSITVVKK